MNKIEIDDLERNFLQAEVFGKLPLLRKAMYNNPNAAIDLINQIVEYTPERRLEAVSSVHNKIFRQIQTSVPSVQPILYHSDLLWAYVCIISYYKCSKDSIWLKHIQPRLEAKIKNRELKEEVTKAIQIINVENERIIALKNDLDINIPKKTEQKIYYFSYDTIRQSMRISRRLSKSEDFNRLTALDELYFLLHSEHVGFDAYGEIEWRAFGITKDKIEKMAQTIEKPDEIVRVLTYLSDHAGEVLLNTATQNEIEEFELECDRIVNKTIKENPSFVKGGYDENKPYLHMIALNMAKPHAEWEEQDKIIFEHMNKPSNYAYTNLFPFEAIYFAAETSLTLIVSIINKEKPEIFDIESIIPNLRAGISMFSYRPIRSHWEAIEQSLYVLSVLAREKSKEENDMYDEISNLAIAYVRDKYKKDISNNVIRATIALQEFKRTNHIESLPKEDSTPIVILPQNNKKVECLQKQDVNSHPDSSIEIDAIQTGRRPIVFISYSWDDKMHEAWVLQLANDLCSKYGVDVILDKWEVKLGKHLPDFMASSVNKADRVICILTPNYKKKSDGLTGGVGVEYSIISAEIQKNIRTEKFIPLFKSGNIVNDIPTFLEGRDFVDMRDETKYNEKIEELVRDIWNKPKYKKPQLGEIPKFD